MSRYYKTNCPECGSVDNLAVYEDHSYCFTPGCGYKKDGDDRQEGRTDSEFNIHDTVDTINEYRSYPLSSRRISKDVVDHFGIKMSVDEDGKPSAHFYPYTKKGKIVAYKERKLPKEFRIHGNFKGTELFGQAQAATGKTLVITEGELDAAAVAEAYLLQYGRFFPVVSLPSASSTSVLLQNREWINRFETVVLLFDQDEAGQKATADAAKIVGPGKCKVATYAAKDPSDLLLEHGHQAVMQAIWSAQTWNPAGILTGNDVWDKFQERQETESVPFPDCLEGLNVKLGGMRHGEITLFTSGTGSGKSTVIKEIVLHLLSTTDERIGLISLEESPGDTAERFISMELQRPLLDPPPLSDKEIRNAFDVVFGDERLVLLDHQGSVSDASLIDQMEYMALMGCRYIILDHITIAVSEGSEGLSGNEAVDKVMSDLLKITKRYDIWLGLVSHLRKAMGGKSFEEGNIASIDDIKGSGSIKQISFDIVAFARNLVAQDDNTRNTINFRVLKSRFTGRTGDAGAAWYNPRTTRLTSSETSFEI